MCSGQGSQIYTAELARLVWEQQSMSLHSRRACISLTLATILSPSHLSKDFTWFYDHMGSQIESYHIRLELEAFALAILSALERGPSLSQQQTLTLFLCRLSISSRLWKWTGPRETSL